MEVVPHTGLGKVKLGMTMPQVASELGEPDTKSSDRVGDSSWYYKTQGIRCDFSADDSWRLGSIEVSTPAFCLYDDSIGGRSEAELCELRDSGRLKGLVLDEEFPELEAKEYACDSLGLSFWICDGVVQSMTIFPRFDASGEVVLWPE